MIEMFASAGGFLLLDQWSKRLAQSYGQDHTISWVPFMRIRCVTNRKTAYRRDGARVVLVLVWCAALLSAIILHRSGTWFQSHVALFGLGVALGGAAGNLMDILRRRHVVDFIDLRWWPVFNLADLAIVAGLVMALWRQR